MNGPFFVLFFLHRGTEQRVLIGAGGSSTGGADDDLMCDKWQQYFTFVKELQSPFGQERVSLPGPADEGYLCRILVSKHKRCSEVFIVIVPSRQHRNPRSWFIQTAETKDKMKKLLVFCFWKCVSVLFFPGFICSTEEIVRLQRVLLTVVCNEDVISRKKKLQPRLRPDLISSTQQIKTDKQTN